MKLKNRILIYLIVPIGLLIKVAFLLILLNLPEGCRKQEDSILKDIEGRNHINILIYPGLRTKILDLNY